MGSFECGFTLVGGNSAYRCPGFQARAEFQPDEQVVAVRGGLRLAHVNSRQVATDVRRFEFCPKAKALRQESARPTSLAARSSLRPVH